MKLALLGYGTVGRHVRRILEEVPALSSYSIKYILRKPGKASEPLMTDDYQAILTDPEIEAVIDALPAVQPSLRYMMQALSAGKHVVTANKAALCEGFEQLIETAESNGVSLLYEASCGGTLPVIGEAAALAEVDEISAVSGILNGTCNYILYHMEQEGMDFQDALKSAQALGYAEADPTADISGYDVRNKAVLLASTAYRGFVTKDVPTAGIEQLSKAVLDYFKNEGQCIKLMMLSRRVGSSYAIGVVPTVLSMHSLEANVPDNFNIASLTGSYSGELKFYGQGAGGFPTADAIVRDLLKLPKTEFRPKQPLLYDPVLLFGSGFFFSADGFLQHIVEDAPLKTLCEQAKAESLFLAFHEAR